MHQDLGVLGGDQAEGAHGFLRRCHVVVPIGQPEGEILAKVADGRGPGGDGRAGVVQRRGQAEHEIAEMRGGGRGIGDAGEILRRVQHDAGAAHRVRAALGRIAHRPVQRHAEPVDARAVLRRAVVQPRHCLDGARNRTKTDMGMLHEAAARGLAALVLGFAGNALGLEKRARSKAPVRRQGAPFREQFGAGAKGWIDDLCLAGHLDFADYPTLATKSRIAPIMGSGSATG